MSLTIERGEHAARGRAQRNVFGVERDAAARRATSSAACTVCRRAKPCMRTSCGTWDLMSVTNGNSECRIQNADTADPRSHCLHSAFRILNYERADSIASARDASAAEAHSLGHVAAGGHLHRAVLELRESSRTDRAPGWSACSPPPRSSRTARTRRRAACHRRRARRARLRRGGTRSSAWRRRGTPSASRSSGCTDATGSGSM